MSAGKTRSELSDAFERIRTLLVQPGVSDDPDAVDYTGALIEQLAQEVGRTRAQLARQQLASSKRVEVGGLIARSVKTLRESVAWTQEEIADAMRRIGFHSWKRITVAEVESGKRKMQIEELLGYAILFGSSLTDILMDQGDDEALVINQHLAISPAEASQLLARQAIGSGLTVSATPYDEIQAQLAGVTQPGGSDDWRPIASLAKTRQEDLIRQLDHVSRLHDDLAMAHAELARAQTRRDVRRNVTEDWRERSELDRQVEWAESMVHTLTTQLAVARSDLEDLRAEMPDVDEDELTGQGVLFRVRPRGSARTP